MTVTILENVLALKNDAGYKQLKKLSETLKSDEIKANGKLSVKCSIECDLKATKKKIAEILEIKESQILLTYTEKK